MEPISSNSASETRSVRKWFAVALGLSLAVHVALYVYFSNKRLNHFAFSAPDTQRLVQRPFTVKKVTINEDLLKPAETPKPKMATPPPKVVPSEDKPKADTLPSDVRLSPNATPGSDAAKAITMDKPRVEAGKLPSPETNAQVDHGLDSIIKDQIVSKSAPKIAAGTGGGVPDSTANGVDDPASNGYSNIDNLLAQSGPLKGSVAPVNMPGGALFEYDSAELRKDAIGTLSKLGTLIQRNPHSTFSIEGYTDSFGSPDYNLELSRKRAEAVKEWLVKTMSLDPDRIQTKGFGSTHYIDPPTGTREQQARNRRVEIVIRTPKE